jgi:DUF4097 and DUF4098 domain-containing protein YvlB
MHRRGSLFGPIVLITLGAMFLIRNFRPDIPVWELFRTYWPVLLIFWGLTRLAENMRGPQPGVPPRPLLGVGEFFLIFFLILFGIAASVVPPRVNVRGPDWDDIFGNTYTFTQEVKQAIPEAQPSILVESLRDRIVVTGTDAKEIEVKAEKSIKSVSEEEARKVEGDYGVEIVRQGSQYLVRPKSAPERRTVRVAVEVRIPKGAALEVKANAGDVNVEDITGPVTVNSDRSDVRLVDIGGKLRLDIRRGSLSAQRIKGNLEMDGRGHNIEIADAEGEVIIRGDYSGDISLANVKKLIHLTTSRTELQLQKLPGKVDMSIGSLAILQPSGSVLVRTNNKDIRIEDFDAGGPVQVTNRDATVELNTKAAPLPAIEVENRSGRIEVTLPAQAAFQIDASSRKGEVESEFSEVSVRRENENGTITGSVGKGGPLIKLHTTYGNVALRKGT